MKNNERMKCLNKKKGKIKLKNSIKNIILIVLFMMIILSSILFKIIGVIPEIELKGATAKVDKPVLTLQGYMEGSYQASYDDWFSQQFPERSYLVRNYSDVLYSLFKKSPTRQVVIGKEGQLFERSYIEEYLGLRGTASDEYYNQLMDDLKFIQELCQKENKYFMVTITPSKVAYYPEYIPDEYIKASNNEVVNKNYTQFIDNLQANKINYYDSFSYLKMVGDQLTIPKFAKTGTHWNFVAGATASNGLLDFIKTKAHYDLPELKMTQIETSPKPFFTKDQDIYDLLNISHGDIDNEYYKPQVEKVGEQHVKKSLFWQGGSFSWHILDYLDENEVFTNMDFMFYQQMIRQYRREQNVDRNMTEGNLEEYLDSALVNKDIIVLEVNQEMVANMGYGFPHKLRKYLEEKGFPREQVPKYYDANEIEHDLDKRMDGFYNREPWIDGYISWMKKDGYITLQDEAISQKGLELGIQVPLDYLNLVNDESKILTVYVNGEQVSSTTFLKSGITKIFIPSGEFTVTEDHKYQIHLSMNTSFNLKEYLGEDDERELSIAIMRIGASDENEEQTLKAFNPGETEEDLIAYTSGIYGPERYGEGMASWMQKQALMTLEDEAISQNGVELEVDVPLDYLNAINSESKVLSIYINNQKVESKVFTQNGIQKIKIPSKSFDKTANHKYKIYLSMNASFNPFKDLGIEDQRDLALRLIYIGAATQ